MMSRPVWYTSAERKVMADSSEPTACPLTMAPSPLSGSITRMLKLRDITSTIRDVTVEKYATTNKDSQLTNTREQTTNRSVRVTPSRLLEGDSPSAKSCTTQQTQQMINIATSSCPLHTQNLDNRPGS